MSATIKAKTTYRNLEYAKKYDNKRYGGVFKGLKNRNTHLAVKKAISNVKNGGTIIDLPCGTGRFADLCATEGFKWIGADISLEMMTVSTMKADKASPPIGHIQCDGENIPLKSASVDATLTIRVLLQFPRDMRVRVLTELARISGEYVIVDYNHTENLKHRLRTARGKLGIKVKKKLRLSLKEIEAEINEAGLKLIDTIPVSKFFSDDIILVCKK